MANDNNGQYYSEQCFNEQLYNEQLYHGTTMKNSNFTNISYDSAEMLEGQVPTSNFNGFSMINYENLEEINTSDLTAFNLDPAFLSSSNNLSSSTSLSPLRNWLTSLNTDNMPSSLNNYEENSYREIQVPSINFTLNGYSNAEAHSQVVYPQYEHEPRTTEEYNPHWIGTEAIPSNEWSYNHGPEYFQNANYENQVYYPNNQENYSQNQQISMFNNSMNSRAGMDNVKTVVKRSRQVFTKYQTKTLEDEYKKNNYVKKARKAELAILLSLSETQIKIWFQNRRTKTKKQSTFQ
ncbi:PREDICTED: homeobox protein EMX1-like [Polistes canadensis]|uniref:homeobox protein EMX1-like n=1 Tax=Polistes canadensis TaxID=91411 RepID=UPI000718ED0E|nr:PREDICTED: homeobox protein EMX1-like [Polistes canadensis]